MKSRFVNTFILGSAALFFQLNAGIAFEGSSVEQSYVTNSQELQNSIQAIAKNAFSTIESLLALQSECHSYDNTIKPWRQFLTKLDQDLNRLNLFKKSQDVDASTCNCIENLYIFLEEVLQNPQLRERLTQCARIVSEDKNLDSFQRYITNSLVTSNSSRMLYLQGLKEEKSDADIDFTILTIEASEFLGKNASQLADRILSIDADTVCVQEIYSEQDAYDLYSVLKEKYAHLIYVGSYPAFGYPKVQHNLLLASKYGLENAQLNKFQLDLGAENEEFFDCEIRNKNKTIGHIFSAHFAEMQNLEMQSLKLEQLLEKMQDNFLKTKEAIPFLLCGNFSNIANSEKSTVFLDFINEGSYNALFRSPYISEYSILSNNVVLTTSAVGTVTSVSNLFSWNFLFNGEKTKLSNVYTVLCKRHAEASASTDTDGNTSARGSLSVSNENEDGTKYSVGISGSVNQDKDGNLSGKTEVTLSTDW